MARDALPLFAGNGEFYVYVYIDPRPGRKLAPIYVGKGTASRADFHLRRGAANPILAAILSKIRKTNMMPTVDIVGRFDSEDDAFALERALIAKFGRRDKKTGTLANMTDGGDGLTGHIPSAKARAASGARMKVIWANLWEDPEFRMAALRNLDAGRSDPHARKKAAEGIRKAKAALAADPVRAAKQSAQRSELRRAAWRNPEIRERYLSSHQDSKEIRRASLKAYYANSPEAVEKRRAWMNERLQNADFRAKLAEGVAKSRKDPKKQTMWAAARAAALAKAGPANKLAWADPIKREARLAAMKATRESRRMNP